jgi:hypothetical protein
VDNHVLDTIITITEESVVSAYHFVFVRENWSHHPSGALVSNDWMLVPWNCNILL